MRIALTHSTIVYVPDQPSFFSKSRHISPVSSDTFGWTMGVEKEMVGGDKGYEGGMMIVRSQRPSLKKEKWSRG